MVLQIKTISEWQWADVFQEKVNNWLDGHSNLNIVDIKYSTAFHEGYGKMLYSAIVIYEYKSIWSDDKEDTVANGS